MAVSRFLFIHILIGVFVFNTIPFSAMVFSQEPTATPEATLTQERPVQKEGKTAFVHGVVRDKKTGNPLKGAKVMFEDLVATAEADGSFQMEPIAVDPVRSVREGFITVTAGDHGVWELDAVLYMDQKRTLEVFLTPDKQFFEDPRPRALTENERSPEPEIGNRSQTDSTRTQTNLDVNPDTINVAITAYADCFNWINAGQPVLRVETMDFKEYVKNVLPNEWISSWHPESLKAGAIASKNYGWRKINVGARHYLKNMHNLEKYPDIVDNTCDQRYIGNTKKVSTNAAVDAIWEYKITRNNNLLVNFYLATESQCFTSPYQPCMPQWGTQYRALEGKSWQQIVEQYYSPVTISLLSVVDVPNGIYRFWSDHFKIHFFTASTSERDKVIRSYSQNIWRYEGVAYKMVPEGTAGSIPVYRFWSDIFGGHFYTTNERERDQVKDTLSHVWRYEGIMYYVYPLTVTHNTTPVYRFWSDRLRSHFYTASEDEKNYVISQLSSTWTFEGEAWRVPVN